MMIINYVLALTVMVVVIAENQKQCDICYKAQYNENCQFGNDKEYTLLHMSVHPHLDAFWIFDYEGYYSPGVDDGEVMSYFRQNKFHSVKQIFDKITHTLINSKKFRQNNRNFKSQKGERSFFNSQIGFFKRWYLQQQNNTKKQVKQLLQTKYWEIVNGAYVEHDQGCAYYEDIISNYQLGLHFLKQQFNYYPKIAISADSFGHSQSTLAILAHMGIQGYFVQRSDQHILERSQAQYIWQAKSANNHTYGALPTHIRWAIHGYENQFDRSVGGQMCRSKQTFINNMRKQNQFLKRIFNNNSHIMRYFGHDFQQFDDYSYSVIEAIMQEFSRQKCNKVAAKYGNPTEYFITLMGQVWKNKQVLRKSQDIFPIWDYDSGLYWTGYFTTDPKHKKTYRDHSRMLHATRKAFLPMFIANNNKKQITQINNNYLLLQQYSQLVAYLQHHDGISGTSKYTVLDQYEIKAQKYRKMIQQNIMRKVYENQYQLYTKNGANQFWCGIFQECVISDRVVGGDILFKVFNSGGDGSSNLPIMIRMPQNKFYVPDIKEYQTVCLCMSLPCACTLYLYPTLQTYTTIRLTPTPQPTQASFLQKLTQPLTSNSITYFYDQTHFTIMIDNKTYRIGYKAIKSKPTPRSYDHLSRYGDKVPRTFTIRSGKYALGNDPKTEMVYSKIREVYRLKRTIGSGGQKFIIKWGREQMKTIITVPNVNANVNANDKNDKNYYKNLLGRFKVETLQAASNEDLKDIYLQVESDIRNQGKFYTDSNGWLVMKRQLFQRQGFKAYFSPDGYDNINGNTYPMTAFTYIKDNQRKLSINTDRPQGITSPKSGTLWLNIDRITQDDGKWVYQSAHRNQYQKYTHNIAISTINQHQIYAQREFQKQYDQPLLMMGFEIQPNQRIQHFDIDYALKARWDNISKIKEIKFWVRCWNNSEITVRVQNMHDEDNQTVGLFAASGNISPLLTSYYGRVVTFSQITEMSMGANMQYKQFLSHKWNWNNITPLLQQNQIFNKQLQQNITLRPLQIRTFNLKNVTFKKQCIQPDTLQYHSINQKTYVQENKLYPMRSDADKQIETDIVQYLLNGDHCLGESPVLYGDSLGAMEMSVGDYGDDEEDREYKRPSTLLDGQGVDKQVMPKDVTGSKSRYGVIEQLKDEPVTLALDAFKRQVQQQPTEQRIQENPQKQHRGQQINNPQQQSTLPKTNQIIIPPQSSLPSSSQSSSQLHNISRLSKQQKQEYFQNKLNHIQYNLK